MKRRRHNKAPCSFCWRIWHPLLSPLFSLFLRHSACLVDRLDGIDPSLKGSKQRTKENCSSLEGGKPIKFRTSVFPGDCSHTCCTFDICGRGSRVEKKAVRTLCGVKVTRTERKRNRETGWRNRKKREGRETEREEKERTLERSTKNKKETKF